MKLKKNRKYGFTLIELLAVIVILAIIALIATPIVLNIIEDSKKSAKLNSANHYIDAVSNAIMKKNMSGETFIPKKCDIQSNGNLLCDGTPIEVEVDGEKPTSGTIEFSDGDTKVIGLGYATGEYFVSGENGMLIDGEPPKTYANGEPVYYNVSTGEPCGASEAVSTSETKSGCMKFYAFNDVEGSETVNLILDHNTTATLAWNSSNSNVNGPSEVLTQLYNDTKDWKGTITPENYTMNQSTQTSGSNYIVEYSKTPSIEGADGSYKARLITAQEIAQITGADIALNWDERLETSYVYYFDGAKGTDETWQTPIANETTPSDYGWLYDRISTSCTVYGCLNNADSAMTGVGYWTVSSAASLSSNAWRVYYGSLSSFSVSILSVNGVSTSGVRPVIEVLKSRLS